MLRDRRAMRVCCGNSLEPPNNFDLCSALQNLLRRPTTLISVSFHTTGPCFKTIIVQILEVYECSIRLVVQRDQVTEIQVVPVPTYTSVGGKKRREYESANLDR